MKQERKGDKSYETGTKRGQKKDEKGQKKYFNQLIH